jgi:hypothetical protein
MQVPYLSGCLKGALICLSICFAALPSEAQEFNYDESKVGSHALPELLRTWDGRQVRNTRQWEGVRRPEILSLFARHVYGRMPGRPAGMRFVTVKEDGKALGGRATRKEVDIRFIGDAAGPVLHIIAWLPNGVQKAPIFIGLNFMGNHSVLADTGITVTDTWRSLNPGRQPERAVQSDRWQVDTLIAHGYGLATAWYQDLEPDRVDGWRTGVRSTLAEPLGIRPTEWGALAVWGWGLSRILDWLETEPRADASRVVATGHSRLGKGALWGAANDTRFAMVVSNESGEGGAAISRRNFGETVKRINTNFPHWFIDDYKSYNGAPERLPVDQHMLLALIAPRPLYVASAAEDLWADPTGEYLGAWHACPTYALYARKGLPGATPPGVNEPVGAAVRYHRRTGKHDVTLYDWQRYIAFADEMLGR